MPSLTEVYKHTGKAYKGRFGLEIETEVGTFDDYPRGFLTMTDSDVYVMDKLPEFKGVIDSSLRNFGVEYVFRRPWDLEESKKLIDRFAEETKDVPFIKGAPATSVHVHLNFQHEDLKTLASFLTLYTFYENVLVEFSGDSRRSNLFALPIRVAEKTVSNIITMLKALSDGNARGLFHHPTYVKYAALNLACLATFGTLEVRMMRGETDPSVLKTWLEFFNDMIEFSKKYSPDEILEKIGSDEAALFYAVFKENAEMLSMSVEETSGEKVSVLTGRNLSYVLDIVRSISVDDWKIFGEKCALRKAPKSALSQNNLDEFTIVDEVSNILESLQNPNTTAQPYPFESEHDYE